MRAVFDEGLRAMEVLRLRRAALWEEQMRITKDGGRIFQELQVRSLPLSLPPAAPSSRRR
jgi:hypothetical protein